MRKLLLSGFALAALATTALAQQPPVPPTAGEPPAAGERSPPPPAAGGPDAMDEPDAGPPSDRAGPPLRDHGRYHEFAFRGHHRPPPPSKAAHFRIEDGDTRIDIKCADDEPTKVCADLLLQLIDKLGTPSQL